MSTDTPTLAETVGVETEVVREDAPGQRLRAVDAGPVKVAVFVESGADTAQVGAATADAEREALDALAEFENTLAAAPDEHGGAD
jgi:hypothetical protein